MRFLLSLSLVLGSFDARAFSEGLSEKIERVVTTYPKATYQVNAACQLALFPGETAPLLSELIERTRAFRRVHLENGREFAPGFASALDLETSASKRSKRQLAKRLRGIETWGEGEVTTPNVAQAGMVFSGPEEIERYLNRANTTRRSIFEILDNKAHVFRMKELTRFKNFMYIWAGMATVTLGGIALSGDLSALMPLAAAWSLFDPFTIVRGRNQDSGIADFERRARAYLKLSEREQDATWVAASRTYRATDSVIDAISERDFRKTRDALRRQELVEATPFWRPVSYSGAMLTTILLKKKSPPSSDYARGFVLTDHVLTFNRKTRQPELLVGVRSTFARPRWVRVKPLKVPPKAFLTKAAG